MSERTSEDAGGDHLQVRAIVFNDHERLLWDGVACILGEPIDVVYRLCALSGAEHYLAELGKMEQAAMAGALLRMFAQSKGIEVVEHEPHTREIHMGRKRQKPETPS